MTGFQNENEIIKIINENCYNDLSSDLKKGLLVMNGGIVPACIKAKKYGGTDKADLSISIDGKEYFVSVKKGSGNSVHQEPIEGFIAFLKTNFEDDESVFNDLRHFIWGDNTLDGTGQVADRLSASQYKNKFPQKVLNIQSYFNRNKKALLERFLITGVVSNKKADYLLYGDINKCTIISDDKLLDYAFQIVKKPISIGVLTFQAWNRNINGGNLSEKKRGQIQLKWGTLADDIKKI